DIGEQNSWDGDFGHLEGDTTAVAHDLRTDRDELLFHFLVSVIIAGFLYSPGPRLVITAKTLALNDTKHGEEFVEIAGATIRTVSRGVIGVSFLQSIVGGIGMVLSRCSGCKPFGTCDLGSRHRSDRLADTYARLSRLCARPGGHFGLANKRPRES